MFLEYSGYVIQGRLSKKKKIMHDLPVDIILLTEANSMNVL